VVSVPVTGNVGDIRSELRRHFGSAYTEDYEIRSVYPSRILPHDMSLQEAQLLPNGTVHAKRL